MGLRFSLSLLPEEEEETCNSKTDGRWSDWSTNSAWQHSFDSASELQVPSVLAFPFAALCVASFTVPRFGV
ncbi:hypothetical protein NL676_016236 [Syzygium grande]|nr:hypothetical protein NL676_016236 [Syzygium grande]